MADADDKARASAAVSAAELMQSTISKRFDEKQGAKDWRRFFTEYMVCVASAGEAFVSSALYTGNIPEPPAITDAMILADDATGVPREPIPTIRQRGLLALLKSGL